MSRDQLALAAIGLFFLFASTRMPRLRPGFWLGVRTPWTLASERVWRATHALARWTFAIGGAATMLAALLPERWRMPVAVAALAIAGFVPVLYSFFAAEVESRKGG